MSAREQAEHDADSGADEEQREQREQAQDDGPPTVPLASNTEQIFAWWVNPHECCSAAPDEPQKNEDNGPPTVRRDAAVAWAAGVEVLTDALTTFAPWLGDGDEAQGSSDTEQLGCMLIALVGEEIGDDEPTPGHLEGLADLLRGIAKIVEGYQPEPRRSGASEGGA